MKGLVSFRWRRGHRVKTRDKGRKRPWTQKPHPIARSGLKGQKARSGPWGQKTQHVGPGRPESEAELGPRMARSGLD